MSNDVGDAKPADRLLAEAVGAWERIPSTPINDTDAESLARAADGDLENRILVRARSLSIASSLREASHHVRALVVMLVFAAVVLVIIAGAGAARAVLGSVRQEPVNIFWAMGSLLGLQSAILVIWLVIMIGSRHVESYAISLASLGGMLFRFAQFLVAKLHKGPEHAAAVAAFGAVNMRGQLGKWTLSAVSNGLWLSFNVGCLVVLIALLSTRQYTFAWETTILSQKQYIPLTRAIGALPQLAGFPVPSDEQIINTQWNGETPSPQKQDQLDEARQAWSGLLLGSVVLYGFGPRLLLLALCLGQRRHARSIYRIDLTQPQYLRLQSRLMPETQSLGVIDDDTDTESRHISAATHRSATRPLGPPAIFGFELSSMQSAAASWPPPVHGVRWTDLGFVDSRADQRRIIDSLANSATEPQAVVVVCSLTTTPDRGVGAFLMEVRAALARSPMIVLSGGDSLRRRIDATHLNQRINDWRQLAMSAGVDSHRVVEVDLQHFTQASSAALSAVLVDGEEQHEIGHRVIEQAFDLILVHAQQWMIGQREPTTAEQADLHRQIALLYRDDKMTWRQVLAAPTSIGANFAQRMRTSAERVRDLLPDRLRRSPKWLAAGAAAGALGCVAAATMIFPAAITALPVWSGIGAALAAVIQPHSPRKTESQSAQAPDFSESLRSACLFALLLELQGRGERTITRILDEIVDPTQSPGTHAQSPGTPVPGTELNSLSNIKAWLAELRHRLDIALAREDVA